MDDIPLISCLVVTQPRPERLRYLERAIADFARQTWPRRELLIVHDPASDAFDAALATLLARFGGEDIRVVVPAGNPSLGALRQASLAAARGAVLCQWDDDDFYHPERLAKQFAALRSSGSEAVLLRDVMQYFPATRTLYCTNWHATEPKGLPGTLMCHAGTELHYPAEGEAAARGEDTAVVAQLQARGGISVLTGLPHLLVYVSHGQNTWSDAHHRMLADRLAISRGLLLRKEAALRAGLAAFDFGGPVTVQGTNGPAFVI